MDNKHRKLFIIKQSKGCKSMPKCTKMRVAAGLRSDLRGELMRSPRLPSRSGGPTSKGREGRGGAYF